MRAQSTREAGSLIWWLFVMCFAARRRGSPEGPCPCRPQLHPAHTPARQRGTGMRGEAGGIICLKCCCLCTRVGGAHWAFACVSQTRSLRHTPLLSPRKSKPFLFVGRLVNPLPPSPQPLHRRSSRNSRVSRVHLRLGAAPSMMKASRLPTLLLLRWQHKRARGGVLGARSRVRKSADSSSKTTRISSASIPFAPLRVQPPLGAHRSEAAPLLPSAAAGAKKEHDDTARATC
jgi:hypothetical protein